jgi:protein HIRA/HIR1
LTLYAASSDGTIAVFNFDSEELDGLAPHSAQELYLAKFGFVPPPLPEGFSHQAPTHTPESQTSMSRRTPPPSPPRAQPSQPQGFGFGQTVNGVGGEHVNKLVAKRGPKNKDKKRVQLMSMSNVPSASTSNVNLAPGSANNGLGTMGMRFGSPTQEIRLSQAVPISGTNPNPSMYHLYPVSDSSGFGGSNDLDADYTMGMDMDVPIDSLNTSSATSKGKRKASAIDVTEDARFVKPRTLGGDARREIGIIREISGGTEREMVMPMVTGANVIPGRPLLTYLCHKLEGGDDTFEGRNSENLGMETFTLVCLYLCYPIQI